MDKVELITASVRCRTCGWLSLLPMVGIPFLALTYLQWWCVRTKAGAEWNPASRQLCVGRILGSVGLLIALATLAGIAGLFVADSL